MEKELYKSKTVLSQVVLAVLALTIPNFKEWIADNPDAYVLIHSVITLIARIFLSNIKMGRG